MTPERMEPNTDLGARALGDWLVACTPPDRCDRSSLLKKASSDSAPLMGGADDCPYGAVSTLTNFVARIHPPWPIIRRVPDLVRRETVTR